jgi:hypothetical protein
MLLAVVVLIILQSIEQMEAIAGRLPRSNDFAGSAVVG